MPYNIDTFKVKQLDNLIIPISSLYKHERKDWHPRKKSGEESDSYIRFENGETVYIEGPVVNGCIHVKHIDWSGESSGTAMDWVFAPALKDSTGILIASCVWEGGDSINQIRVHDGNIEWVDIEI